MRNTNLSTAGLLALTAVMAFGVAGCTKGASSPSGTKHFFEGAVEWHGLQGSAPGKPWSMRCTMRHEDLLCDVDLARGTVQLGFRGPGSTVCFRSAKMPMWIPLSLQTVGMLFAFLPENIRRDAVHTTQAEYTFTGQRRSYLGRSCEIVAIRDRDGSTENVCYSEEEFFEGDQKLVPVLHQMGFEPGFITNLSKYGIGYSIYSTRASGEPSMTAEITRMDPRPVDPAMFAGVCGQP